MAERNHSLDADMNNQNAGAGADANRNPRLGRSGKSYDYHEPTDRTIPKKDHDYLAQDKAAGKSYDYMFEDQNLPQNRRQNASAAASRNNVVAASNPAAMPVYYVPAPPPPRKMCNPGPVGLLGFGMTTVLLNLHNTGHYSLNTIIPAMGICYGGGAQFIAGLLEFHRGNTFAFVAFCSYGAFWLSLVCTWMLPNASFSETTNIIATSQYFVGVYLLLWGIFTFFMMLCTLRMNWALFIVFLTLLVLFFLLAIGNMANSPTLLKVAGYEGVVCGSTALYLAFAEILNEVYDTTILPIGPIKNFPPNSWRWSTVMKKLGLGATESSVEDGR